MKNEVIKEEKIDLGVISVEYREREEKDLRERGVILSQSKSKKFTKISFASQENKMKWKIDIGKGQVDS